MKQLITLLLLLVTLSPVFAQETATKEKKKKTQLHLTNALVIGQIDNSEDRYTVEINLTDMLTRNGVKTIPSLNVLKLGSDAIVLATDSMQQKMAAKGIDTYVLVSVRGYDRKFKVSEKQDDFKTALEGASLFDLYRDDIVSISFEFKFFRNGQFVYGEIVKCGNVGDRESVMKKFRSKVEKRIVKKWKK